MIIYNILKNLHEICTIYKNPLFNHKNKKAPEIASGAGFGMVIQEGFEPPTHGLEGRCSIQLRY